MSGEGTSDEQGYEYNFPVLQEHHPLDRRAEKRAERLIALWFVLSAVASVAFTWCLLALDVDSDWTVLGFTFSYTMLLGLTLGIALSAVGIGVVLWAKRLMPEEELVVQTRHEMSSSEENSAGLARDWSLVADSSGLGRRPLIRRSLLLAGGAFAVPLVGTLFTLGPTSGFEQALGTTQWAKGRRLVRMDGTPVKIGEVRIGGIETVFPEGHLDVQSQADGATMLIRLKPGENIPMPGRENWAVDDHVAYSKICTHAGCPLGLYEQQTHNMLCPCHQSTFLVTEHCKPIFGPATRSLPQLAIALDEDGYFIAQGDYSEPVGVSYWERD